jgi:hypothetical protein
MGTKTQKPINLIMKEKAMYIRSSIIQQNPVLAPVMKENSENTLLNVPLLVICLNSGIINLKK